MKRAPKSGVNVARRLQKRARRQPTGVEALGIIRWMRRWHREFARPADRRVERGRRWSRRGTERTRAARRPSARTRVAWDLAVKVAEQVRGR